MNHRQLQDVALITNVIEVDANETLFTMGDKAEALYFLLAGSIELHYVVIDEHLPQLRKDFMVGTVSPREVFSISAVIEPYELTTTAVTTQPCRLLKTDAAQLRALCAKDAELDCRLQSQCGKAAMERLHATRILLAAATGPA